MIETLTLGMEGNFLYLIKDIYKKFTAVFLRWKTECFSPKTKKRTEMSTHNTSIQRFIDWTALARAVKQENEIKGIQVGKK